MTRLVHRRRLRSGADEPKGPGGTIGPILAPLSVVGWVSIVATIAYVVIALNSPASGVFSDDGIRWLQLAYVLASCAVILAPAALELGYPGVRRRNPPLLVGLALLAFVEVSRPLASWLTSLASAAIGPGPDDPSSFDPNAALEFVYQLTAVARQVIALAGWLSILGGLALAGARPRRWMLGLALLAIVGPPTVFDAISLWVAYQSQNQNLLDSTVPLPQLAMQLVVDVARSAGLAFAMAALIRGANLGLRPRLGWRLGAAVAATALVAPIVLGLAEALAMSGATVGDGSPSHTLLTVSSVLTMVFRILLLAACLAGLGRGTDERHLPMWRVYWVWGARRFRPAAS